MTYDEGAGQPNSQVWRGRPERRRAGRGSPEPAEIPEARERGHGAAPSLCGPVCRCGCGRAAAGGCCAGEDISVRQNLCDFAGISSVQAVQPLHRGREQAQTLHSQEGAGLELIPEPEVPLATFSLRPLTKLPAVWRQLGAETVKGEQRGREEAGSVQRPFKKQLGDTCQHFPGLQPWMSNTEELPFLDPALQKQAVKVKKMENLKKKVEWKKEKKQKLMDKRKHPEQTDAKDPGLLRQCLGPGCVHPTRPGSKYCSDDCGMKLAADRIYNILPQRIQQWQKSPCIADEHGKKMLELIHREQQNAYIRLKDAESHFHELEAIILRGKQQAVCKDGEVIRNGWGGAERYLVSCPTRPHSALLHWLFHYPVQSNEDERNSINLQIFCVSCGQPISRHIALRHMERCFAKYECKSSFGSFYPTCIEGATRLFCDVYDPQSKRYCKRLQVLCPEHSRDPKVPDDEVCGCPLVHNVFELTGNFCALPKILCNRHYCWEKLRRAEVDLERIRALHKLEELEEQENKVRTAMTNRAGLLALMLHQTIQHDPLTSDLRSRVDS
nr:CXXC-type zinc finger protein 1-like [Equus caballus]